MSKREATRAPRARRTRHALTSMIDASTVAALLTDPRQPDNPIVHCNQAFLDLTGYELDEVVGRNCRFLAGPATEPELSERIRQGVRDRLPVLVNILNFRKDGTPFRNGVLVVPIFGEEGELEFFLGSQNAAPDPSAAASRANAAREMIRGLTPRQRQVLAQMASGRLNKQAANALRLTERTVKMHRAALLKALKVRSAAEAIRLAVEAGL